MIQYFLADVTEPAANIALARKLGLGYAFDSGETVPFHKRGIMANGPGEKSGVVISHCSKGLGYFPDRQTWQKHKTVPNVWIGVDKTGEPLEYVRKDWQGDDRPLITESWPLVCNIGRVWHVPVARAYGETLPHDVDWDGKKFVQGKVIEKFRRLDEIAHLLVENYDKEPRQLPENYHEICFEIINAAYLIGQQEYCMLKIVGWEAQEAYRLTRLTMDMPGAIERDQKKTDTEPAG